MTRFRPIALLPRLAVALLACAAWAFASGVSAAPTPTPARPAAKRAAAPSTATPRRPLTLAAQTIEGRSEAPRVLFVHTGPKLALEDAPIHPSYLRDDFTAALSSPVTVRVWMMEPLHATPTSGGSR
ncbi:MAG: hypothetical protein ABI960_06810 [Candidatus Eisenbacteria bacterium]